MYSSLAMGDRLTGEASAALSALGVVGVVTAPGADGPVTSSTTSVTTSPRFIISLFHITHLWGKSILDVCTCCHTVALLTVTATNQPPANPENRTGQTPNNNHF